VQAGVARGGLSPESRNGPKSGHGFLTFFFPYNLNRGSIASSAGRDVCTGVVANGSGSKKSFPDRNQPRATIVAAGDLLPSNGRLGEPPSHIFFPDALYLGGVRGPKGNGPKWFF
jgi:hypothetical protein